MPQSTSRRPVAAREANPLFRREMRERWRRPITVLQLALFAGVLAYLGYNIYITIVPQSEFDISLLSGTGRRFFFALANAHMLAWIPAGLLLAAPTLAAERERGHLFEWVLASLSARDIVSAKFRALAGFVLVMVCVPFPIFALCFPLGGVSPLDFLSVGFLTLVVALNSVALGVLISATSARVTSAITVALVASAVFLFFGVAILNAVVGIGWGEMLGLGLGLCWLPQIWIAAAYNAFDMEVEKHIKGDADFIAERRMESAQRLNIGPDGRLEPPRFEALPVGAPAEPGERVAPPTVARPARARRAESFTEIERLVLRFADRNAIAARDVRRRFVWRHGGGAGEAWAALWVWLLVWALAGTVGATLLRIEPDGGLFPLFACLILAPAMGYVALEAAPGFTRERAQKMLSALQMTALSPADIVWGKAGGALLLCAQFFGGLLLALCVTALAYGPLSAIVTAVFAVSCVVFTALGSLTLSLWSRKTEIVALGALAGIAALWWVLPTLYLSWSDMFHAPRWLEVVWLAPIRVLLRPPGDGALALALLQLSSICAASALVLAGLCIWQLRRTRAEEEETGLFQRDLSRGLR